jgi:uncharacterized protein
MSQPTPEKERRFAIDRMLGRLARMLRLLGYDAVYSPSASPAELAGLAQREGRLILTRGDPRQRFRGIPAVFSLRSDSPAEQLREVVSEFDLDTQSGLWTRCTLCNGLIASVEKSEAAAEAPPKAFAAYTDFYRCSGCGHVYWRGSHVERMLKNLASILDRSPDK